MRVSWAHKDPCRPCATVVEGPAHDGGVAFGGQRDGVALRGSSPVEQLWVQTSPRRVKTHAAPVPPLSKGPPRMAVLPSVDSATERPCRGPKKPPTAPVPTSLLPCWVQTSPRRMKTHAAPLSICSLRPVELLDHFAPPECMLDLIRI